MPVAVAPKSVRPCFSVRHGGSLITVACHRVPQAAQPSATRPWKGPRATRGLMSWSAGTQRTSPGKHLAGHLPRQAPCRGSRPCRARKLAAPRAPCRGAYSAEALSSGLPGKLLSPGSCDSGMVLSLVRPSRQAPLAGVSISCLVYFVFEWFNREQEGLRRARSKPCRGKLQLPVHKLGY